MIFLDLSTVHITESEIEKERLRGGETDYHEEKGRSSELQLC